MDIFKVTRLVFLILILSACQSAKRLPFEETSPPEPFPILDNTFVFSDAPILEKDIFSLSVEQKQDFLRYFKADENQYLPEHKRLLRYMERKLNSFDYMGKTLIASKALSEEQGNCLSLAIVTAAFADLVGLKTRFQKVNSPIIYRRYQHVMTTSGHVRTFVYDRVKKGVGKDGYVQLVPGFVIVDYFPGSGDTRGEFVSQVDFISMYHQNLAGDAIVKKDFELAFAHINTAIKLNQYNANTLNSLAVLFKHTDQHNNAREIFEFAMNNSPKTLNLVSNYAGLLKQSGETEKANLLFQNIDSFRDENPYT